LALLSARFNAETQGRKDAENQKDRDGFLNGMQLIFFSFLCDFASLRLRVESGRQQSQNQLVGQKIELWVRAYVHENMTSNYTFFYADTCGTMTLNPAAHANNATFSSNPLGVTE
jgi:hypothetical protein